MVIDLITRINQVNLMKVKIGELKTHFSKYLRRIGETGQSIEVCIREEPVAYLNPVKTSGASDSAKRELAEQLSAAGIRVCQWGREAVELGSGGRAEIPAKGPNSIETIRQERSW